MAAAGKKERKRKLKELKGEKRRRENTRKGKTLFKIIFPERSL